MTPPTGTDRLFLIGPRGAGKTTCGRLLAARLGWAFHDTDDVVARLAGKSPGALLRSDGEPILRDWEVAALAELAGAKRIVIATGGGIVLRPANRAILKSSGRTVWLTADPVILWQRIKADAGTTDRPPLNSLGGQAEVEELFRQRELLYREVAHAIIDTAGRTPEQVAAAILTAC